MDAGHFLTFITDAEAGNIKLNISKIFTLDELFRHINYIESNSSAGEIVVVV